MAKYAINYNGLRLKPSYDSLVHTIADQPMIIYPNRQAMQLRDSPYMTQLMNSADIKEQQARIQMEQVKQAAVTQAAANTGGTRAMVQATAQADPPSQPPPGGDGPPGGPQPPPTGPKSPPTEPKSPPGFQTPLQGVQIGSGTPAASSPSGYGTAPATPAPLAKVPGFPIQPSVSLHPGVAPNVEPAAAVAAAHDEAAAAVGQGRLSARDRITAINSQGNPFQPPTMGEASAAGAR